jgi:hypothetical protein
MLPGGLGARPRSPHAAAKLGARPRPAAPGPASACPTCSATARSCASPGLCWGMKEWAPRRPLLGPSKPTCGGSATCRLSHQPSEPLRRARSQARVRIRRGAARRSQPAQPPRPGAHPCAADALGQQVLALGADLVEQLVEDRAVRPLQGATRALGGCAAALRASAAPASGATGAAPSPGPRRSSRRGSAAARPVVVATRSPRPAARCAPDPAPSNELAVGCSPAPCWRARLLQGRPAQRLTCTLCTCAARARAWRVDAPAPSAAAAAAAQVQGRQGAAQAGADAAGRQGRLPAGAAHQLVEQRLQHRLLVQKALGGRGPPHAHLGAGTGASARQPSGRPCVQRDARPPRVCVRVRGRAPKGARSARLAVQAGGLHAGLGWAGPGGGGGSIGWAGLAQDQAAEAGPAWPQGCRRPLQRLARRSCRAHTRPPPPPGPWQQPRAGAWAETPPTHPDLRADPSAAVDVQP